MTKRAYSFLVLTDHSGHSQENSIYALLNTLAQHPQCASVTIASRGNAENARFFNGQHSHVYGRKLVGTFEFDPSGKRYLYDQTRVEVADFDVIFLRLPRPIPDRFFERLQEWAQGKVMINHPKGILATSTKAFLLNLPDCCPPMQLVRSAEEVLAVAKSGPIVLKPLRDYGGKGIVRVSGDQIHDGNAWMDAQVYLRQIEQQLRREGMLAMAFLKNVDQGDKRILVVGGEIMAASLRMPAPDSWLCNVAQGGTSISSEPTDRERALIETIKPLLDEEGVFIYGVDTLVGDDGQRLISEINTLSIGGFPQAEAQTGRPVLALTIQKMIDYVVRKYES